MISVIPPDWKAQFMGSDESLAYINSSKAIQYQVSIGKLDLTYIPKNMSVSGQEEISQFLTTLWIYDTVLHPAENLLLFQTDKPEDVWLSERLGHLPNGKLANGTVSNEFSVENTYADQPMGYHLGHSGRGNPAAYLGTPEKRQKVWDYCPEIKMLTDMDPEQYMPGHCNENWKRSGKIGSNGFLDTFVP
ncbi:MAG: hypothetical protein Q9207_002132, partial [Kuettlingeria erythrocarpa]